MTEAEDHQPLADHLDREADMLAEQSARLKNEIGSVRDDWHQKRGDPGVPGAVPPAGSDDQRDQAADQRENREAGAAEVEGSADAAGKDESSAKRG